MLDNRSILAALLKGRADHDAFDPSALADLAVRHRVHVLAAEASAMRRGERWDALTQALRDAARQETARTQLRATDATQVLEGLAAGGIRALVLKGAALAHTVYAEPAQRPRVDTDILVHPDDAARIQGVMTRLGYQQVPAIDGPHVRHQCQFARRTPAGIWCDYDLHWQLAEPEPFAHLISFEALAAASIPVPALGAHARAPGAVHALFIACVHRAAHHPGADDLIWLYDIDLLAGRLSAEEWQAFVDLAARTRTRAVCRHGLDRAAEAFGTRVPAEAARSLPADAREPTAKFVAALRTFDVEASSFQALGWRARGAFVREHLFPSAAYMRERYRRWPRILLPLAYVHRIARGAPGWFRRPDDRG